MLDGAGLSVPPRAIEYVEGQPSHQLFPAIEVDVPNGSEIQSATVKILQGHQWTEDVLSASEIADFDVTFNRAAGILKFVGEGTVQDYERVLRSTAYINTSGDPDPTKRRLEVRVNVAASDPEATLEHSFYAAHRRLAVIPVDTPPSLLPQLPGRLTTGVNRPILLPFVQVHDPDVGDGLLDVQIEVDNGTTLILERDALNLFVVEQPTDSGGRLHFQGDLTTVNEALAELRFSPAADTAGMMNVTIAVKQIGTSKFIEHQLSIDVVSSPKVISDATVIQYQPGVSFQPLLGWQVISADIGDQDANEFDSATVAVVGAIQTEEQYLALSEQPGIISSLNEAGNRLTIQRIDASGDVLSALHQVEYLGSSDLAEPQRLEVQVTQNGISSEVGGESAVLLVPQLPESGFVQFDDVASESGIAGEGGFVFGANWLDFNGDGRDDLWVGRHNNRSPTEDVYDSHAPAPSLFIQQSGGSFLDEFETVFDDDFRADYHGALWIDIDNDGDPDLLQSVGANRGSGPRRQGAAYWHKPFRRGSGSECAHPQGVAGWRGRGAGRRAGGFDL